MSKQCAFVHVPPRAVLYPVSPPLSYASELLRGHSCSRWPAVWDSRGSFDSPELGSPGSFAVSLSRNGFSRATAAGAARETAAAFEAPATGWRLFGSLFMLSLNFKSWKSTVKMTVIFIKEIRFDRSEITILCKDWGNIFMIYLNF